jgi:hypothetical protein
MQFAVAYDNTLSIANEQSLESMVTIYPNPSSKEIHIVFNSVIENPIDFSLVDIKGVEVIQKPLTQQNEVVKIDSLSKGNYLAVFRIENLRVIKKVILK